ncbi:mycofactocin biosynthesis peptidyl-dipeptidase MftE [Citricoccus sp. I39-566]|uniref:mycofactocin biosynthesis peptidyl-dipeptidase MftE n=1 Tax=Citricoccus sp. I39-566 TaxID=3073268 RepID=UPI00286A08AA|nr:mycofactocin biosynthesis peptidyl-dipeptidase MftE [Citricoccus sp. I39-566]WMY77207.1 mycofactocin biosynthesis peptidyl-dipeptidase MftE [Citricoccus sp. I39-566]
MRLVDTTWPEVRPESFGGRAPILVVPVGALEQHGPHLPLDTDAAVAAAIAAAVAAERDHAALAPTLPFGASGEHAGFPGTLSIGADALHHILIELVRSSTPTFAAVMVINGHGGNVDALRSAAALCTAEGRTLLPHPLGLPGMDAHAGRTETSLMLHLDPSRVRLDRAAPGNTAPLTVLLPELRTHGVRGVSPNGVLGDPTGASAAEGAELFDTLVERALTAFDRLPG